MKIYASKKQNISIDDFVGQDVWIKCHLMEDYYVRPIRKLDADEIYRNFDIAVNLYPVWWVDRENYPMSDFEKRVCVDEWLAEERILNSRKIKPFVPLEILSTDDLYEMIGYV